MALSEIARSVQRLDAGLVSPESAMKDILDAVKQQEPQPRVSGRQPVRVAWAESTRRILRDEFSGLLSVPVELVSGRNEHEVFQLALSTDYRLDGLTLRVEPFVSEDGESREFRTGAYLEEDTLVTVPLVARNAGPYPNVLRPLGEFGIVPNMTTRLWIDIYMPDDTPAGQYRSEMRIESQNVPVARVPIRLRVFPLRIPTAPSIPAVVGLNYQLVAGHFGLDEQSDACRKLMESAFWFLVERRLSPFQPPVSIDSPTMARYLRDERVSACRIPLPPNDPLFRSAALLAAENGWLDKLFTYFIDEPTYHQYKAIINTGKAIHSMSPSPKFLVTCFPDEPLVGAVDIWCVHIRFLPEGLPHSVMDRRKYVDAVRRRLEAGDAVWWYTAGAVRPFPTLQIEDDPTAFRIIPWLQQLYGIGGFLHWETANWSQPFDEPLIEYFGNAEGVLVYPGDLRLVPSIRLELLREGLEDMEYLMLLRRTVEEIQKKLGAERLGDIASVRVREMCRRLFPDEALQAHAVNDLFLLPHFAREAGSTERVRQEVAEEAVALADRPLTLVLTDPEEKQYTDSTDVKIYGVVEPGCRVEINGQVLDVGETGGFSARFPVSSGTNGFFIRIEKDLFSKTIVRKIEAI
jgi:hypothetical protein